MIDLENMIAYFKNAMQIYLIFLILINATKVDLKNEASAANASIFAHVKKSNLFRLAISNSQQPRPIMVLHAKYFPINFRYVAARRISVSYSAHPFVYRHYFMEECEQLCIAGFQQAWVLNPIAMFDKKRHHNNCT